MQSYSLAEQLEVEKIYLIIRVYNIASDEIGMDIYIDPEELRQEETLVFTADAWKVCPGEL